jgi:hypothetical protein
VAGDSGFGAAGMGAADHSIKAAEAAREYVRFIVFLLLNSP